MSYLKKVIICLFIFQNILSYSQSFVKHKNYLEDFNNDGCKDTLCCIYETIGSYINISFNDGCKNKLYKIKSNDWYRKDDKFHIISYPNKLLIEYPELINFISEKIFRSDVKNEISPPVDWLLSAKLSNKIVNDSFVYKSFYVKPKYFKHFNNKSDGVVLINSNNNNLYYNYIKNSFSCNDSLFDKSVVIHFKENIWYENKQCSIKINNKITLLTDSCSIVLKKGNSYAWLYFDDEYFLGFPRLKKKLRGIENARIQQLNVFGNYVIVRLMNTCSNVLIFSLVTGKAIDLNLNDGNVNEFVIKGDKLLIFDYSKGDVYKEFDIPKIIQLYFE